MSWSIELVTNTVKISLECAKELFEAQGGERGEIWNYLEEVAHKGYPTFSRDHMEWMDWLSSHTNLVEILKRYKVGGDVCFGSLEGDNAGEFWGYRFDGKGGVVNLVGRVVYEEKREPLTGKVFTITGTLADRTRKAAYQKIRELGGEISETLTKRTTHLLVGEKPGSKLAEAKKRGISVTDEKQLSVMIEQRK